MLDAGEAECRDDVVEDPFAAGFSGSFDLLVFCSDLDRSLFEIDTIDLDTGPDGSLVSIGDVGSGVVRHC